MRTLFKPFRSFVLVAVLMLLACAQARAVTDVSYDWRSVVIQGGGYVTGMVVHPLDGNTVYARSDVAGSFRWDSTTSSWISLSDKLMTSDPITQNWLGTESLAVDPTNTNKLFIAVGAYGQGEIGLICRSGDKGATWSTVQVPFLINGNLDGRYGGERLAVDPNNVSVIYYGTRKAGVWKSTDGAASWSKLNGANFVGGGEDGWKWFGVMWVAIDSNGGTTTVGGQTVSSTLYAGVYNGSNPNYNDGGIYRSTDGGQTWAELGNSPNDTMRGGVAADGTLWVSSWTGLYKMARGGSSLASVSPIADGYNALAIDPSNASHVIVGTSGGFNQTLYRTTNGGSSWSALNMTFTKTNPGTTPNERAAISQIAINAANPNQVWYGDWYNAWRTENVTANPSHWTSYSSGYESLVNLSLGSPSAGIPLMSGAADHAPLRHTTLTSVPTSVAVGGMYETTGIDFCEADPNYFAVVGGFGWEGSGGGMGGISTDNGASFTAWSNMSTYKVGLVAVGATKTTSGHPNIVHLPKDQGPRASANGGSSWSRTRGAPTSSYSEFFDPRQVLASDRVNGDKFYLWHRASGSGTLYVSTNGGVNWSSTASLSYGSSGTQMRQAWMEAIPGREGELWLAIDDGNGDSARGLYKVTGSGSVITKIGAVQRASIVTVGAPPSGSSTATVFIHGYIDGVRGLFRSDDNGASWGRIYNQDVEKKGALAYLKVLKGSRQVYGRLYAASGGRGVWVGESSGSTGSPPAAPTNLAATAGDAQVALTWSASSGASSYNVQRSTSSGSGYATVANVTTTGHTDAGLTNGITYYYVVSALNSYGESANSNEASATPAGSSGGSAADIASATSAPAIDGGVDSVWANATAYDITKVTGTVSNDTDLSGTWKALWDASNLYVLVEVTDDKKLNDSTNPWDDDSAEVFVDGGNENATSYDANDRQYVFGWGDSSVVEGAGRNATGVVFGKGDPSSTSYRLEAKIPWSAVGVTVSSGQPIGIDVHVNDDDKKPTARDGKKAWWDGTDGAWGNPSLFGTGMLNP